MAPTEGRVAKPERRMMIEKLWRSTSWW